MNVPVDVLLTFYAFLLRQDTSNDVNALRFALVKIFGEAGFDLVVHEGWVVMFPKVG